MDETGKRKRIEITDEERFDDLVMSASESIDGDNSNDDTTSFTDFDTQKNDSEENIVTIVDGSQEAQEEGSGDETNNEHVLDENFAPEEATTKVEIIDVEPESAETASVDTDVEPETIATTLVEQEPATVADRPNAFQEPSESSAVAPVATAPLQGLSSTKSSNKKRFMIIAGGVVLFIVLAFLTWWLLGSKEDTTLSTDQPDTTVTAPAEQPKLGIAVTITEGTVEYKQGEAQWQAVTAATELNEGDSVRTGKASRVVLTLDDGSAIRLDANTTIKLTSLTANQIQVEHLDGIAYSRVVPSSERTYTITAGEATYQALGTAFTTVKNEANNGVQVFESSVMVNGSPDAVVEGKQFFQESSDDTLEGVVSDIDIDALVKNSFINWNLSLDEKDNNFKDKLGVLPQIEKRATKIKQEAAEAAAKLKAEQEAAAKKAAEEKARRDQEARANESAAAMTLGVGEKNLLEWTYLGKPTNGYKLVYSKENTSPVFKADSSQYISSSSQTSARLSSKLKGKYYVRVCAYTKESTCVDYSNVVVITI